MPTHTLLITCILAAFTMPAQAADPPAGSTLLLRQPSVSGALVAFAYAGDVWIAQRSGRGAQRLTVHPGVEANPTLSPDAQWVAFSGEYDGNVDVFIVPVSGGAPRRLTFHPGRDEVRGWTPDGQAVLFRSSRLSPHHHRSGQLFTVPLDGGLPDPLPMPHAEMGAISADGALVAYTPFRNATATWKRYRGGRTTPIWIFDLQTWENEEVPHDNATDTAPVWLGDTLYFLSDRHGTMNVFSLGSDREVRQVTEHTDMDVRAMSAGGGVLAYEQAGRIHLLEPTTDEGGPLDLQVTADLPAARPHLAAVTDQIHWMGLSPTGARALFGARGEILTVPAEHGDVRNLTRTPGIHERFGIWSPDGESVAYLSDASGEYQLVLAPQNGRGPTETIPLGDPTFYHGPVWSPDGGKLAYTDKRLNLWWLDLDGARRPMLVDTEPYDEPPRGLAPVWSPDGRWLAYTRRLDNHLRAVFLHDTNTGRSHQMTDGMSDCASAAFSRDGTLLYFAASTDVGLAAGWLDMSSYEQPRHRSIYVAVLAADGPSPLAPRSDEEGLDEDAPPEDRDKHKRKGNGGRGEETDEPVVVRIDLDGLDQRILALPVESADLSHLEVVDGGQLLYLAHGDEDDHAQLHRYDPEERESVMVLEGVLAYTLSADGKQVLVAQAEDTYRIVEAGAEPGAAAEVDPLDLSGLRVQIDPGAEWAQIYDETLRIFRDYFYDPGMHGIDWVAMGERYRPYLAHVGHRDDLNYLLGELMGELVVGHAYRWGGDYPDANRVDVGLLGADLVADGAFYRIGKVFSGLNWNPALRSPLTEPGVGVAEGDVILEIDGQPLRVPDNPYRLLQGKAGIQVVLRVNDRPSDAGAREVTIVPLADEAPLRHRAWIEGNRSRVDEATDGEVAYVYVPNTAWAGYTEFNRYFYAQLDRHGVILDERYNGGGSVADYMVDALNRRILNWNVTREGRDYPSPLGVLPGPRVMLINQDAGSGGDCLPHYFRMMGLGPLIGTRTWGGLIGIYDYPPLIDGGVVTAPRIAFYGPDGQWTAENVGVIPDIEVEMTPRAVLEGGDPQLERAIEEILQQIREQPQTPPARPPFPNYSD